MLLFVLFIPLLAIFGSIAVGWAIVVAGWGMLGKHDEPSDRVLDGAVGLAVGTLGLTALGTCYWLVIGGAQAGGSSAGTSFLVAYWRYLVWVGTGLPVLAAALRAWQRRRRAACAIAVIAMLFASLILVPPTLLEHAVFWLTGDRRFTP